MLFYFLVYASIPVLYGYSYLITKQLNNRLFLWLAGIELAFISGNRAITVGTDTQTYSNIFAWYLKFKGSNGLASHLLHVEYGYLYLNRIVRYWGGTFPVLMMMVACITVFGYFYFIENFSSDYLTSVLLFLGLTYYFLSMNISRQMLAVSVGLIALVFLKRQQRWESLLLIILAGTLHNVGYLFVALWIISQLKFNKSIFMTMVVSTVIVGGPVVMLMEHFMKNSSRYRVIVETGGSGKGVFGIVYTAILFILMLLLIYCFDYQNSMTQDRLLIYGMLIITFFNVLNLRYGFLGRVRFVFEPMMVAIVPYMIECLGMKKIRALLNIGIFIVGLIAMYKMMPGNIFYGVVPYSLWDDILPR